MLRLAVFLAALSPLAAPAEPPAARGEPTAARRAELVEFVRQDCGACHGLALSGGLGPSLQPAALADKDPEVLGYVILNGRRGTAMPPWKPFLTEAEARWIVETLKQGFPK